MKARCPNCANSKEPIVEPVSDDSSAILIVSCGHCRRVFGVLPDFRALLEAVQALRDDIASLREVGER